MRPQASKVMTVGTVAFVLAASIFLIRHIRNTDIHGAIRSGDTAAVREMLASRPELIEITKDYGYTPLLAAAEAGHADIVDLLLAKGCTTNENDYFGNTGLHLAAGKGHTQAVRVMLAHGADPSLKNNQSDLPLHLAADAGHLEIARMLIEAGSDIDAQDYRGQTPLKRAVDRGQIKVAELLRTRGAKEE